MTRRSIAPADDVDRIMAVMEAAFPPDFGEAWTRAQLESALMSGLTSYWLIGADGSVPAQDPCAGFALTRTVAGEAELLLIAVVPAARRRGLGGQLLDRVAADLREAGVTRLLLEVRRGNSAKNLYETNGFIQIGERANYYRGPAQARFDALTLARALD